MKHAPPLKKARCRVGVGINKYMAMIECGNELHRLGEQHAVAEYIA